MTNVISFPNARSNARSAAPIDNLLDELTAVEIEIAHARLAQMRSETRQAQQLWAWQCCKKVLFWVFVLWLMTHFVHAASAQSRSFYDGRGSFAGTAITRGKTTNFYNKSGQLSGTAINTGRSTSIYDGRGRFSGSVVNTGPRR